MLVKHARACGRAKTLHAHHESNHIDEHAKAEAFACFVGRRQSPLAARVLIASHCVLQNLHDASERWCQLQKSGDVTACAKRALESFECMFMMTVARCFDTFTLPSGICCGHLIYYNVVWIIVVCVDTSPLWSICVRSPSLKCIMAKRNCHHEHAVEAFF